MEKGQASWVSDTKNGKFQKAISAEIDAVVADIANSADGDSIAAAIMARPDVMFFALRRRFDVNDFLNVETKDFISFAYLGILRRKCTSSEIAYWQQFDLISRSSRIEILNNMVRSEEGLKKKVRIEGLATLQRVNRVFQVPGIRAIKGLAKRFYR